MPPQRLAHCESNEPGAIPLLLIPSVGEMIKLKFGDRCEPGTKVLAVVK
jgi:hypothetical protein